MHIGLDVGETEVDRVAKRSFGVLRMHLGTTAVGEPDRTAMVEEGVDARHVATVLGYGRAVTAADELTEMLSSGDDIPLDRTLFLLAGARPDARVTVAEGISALDELADSCPDPTLKTISHHLFVDQGFSGDHNDYHDPRNSYLDEVLVRRVGMPITLSAVLLEIGRRLGVPLDGVGMPGHFLVRDRVDPDVFIDSFHRGAQISTEGCLARFRSLHGPETAFDPSYLAPVPTRSIVMRVLNNLTVTFRSRSPRDLEWLLDIRLRIPADPPDLAALADLCELRGRFGDAARLLDRVRDITGSDAAGQQAMQLRARLN